MNTRLLTGVEDVLHAGVILNKNIIKYAMAGALTALTATSASSQAIVMRRPLPRVTEVANPTPGTPTPTPAPGDPTPDPTPGNPGSTPDETPPVVEDPATELQDPIVRMCNQDPTSPDAKVTDVEWVEAGWNMAGSGQQNCNTQTMTYSCQATYTCEIDGRMLTFTSSAPDATCENYPGEVRYPAGAGPATNPTAAL